MSVDLDDIRENRLERNQKGRKVSKSIEHMSTTGTSAGGDSLGQDAAMQSSGEEIEESKFAMAKKANKNKAKAKEEPLKKAHTFKIRANQLCALKIISKRQVLQTSQQQHIYNEFKYMGKMHHNLVCGLKGVHQDMHNLYILEEYLQFGELLNLLIKYKRLNVNLTRFYAAQVVEVFDYMHKRDLIYRDLKPENVLLQNNGYIKLTDFGFVKKIAKWDRTYTLCGTPEYMAPEVIMNTGHGQAADWYTLGIFMYELLNGLPPFMHNDTYEIF